MSRPRNNLALTLSDVYLKTFVKETDEPSSGAERQKKYQLAFEGNEAKLVYDEIVSDETQRKSIPRQCKTTRIDVKERSKTPTKTLNKTEQNVNTLFRAIESGDENFVSQHFHSENVNICDQFGWTPLMSAAYSGHIGIVSTLLKLGANKKVKDKSGLRAIDLASKKNHVDIIHILKEKPKKDSTTGKRPVDNKNGENSTNGGFYCDICKIFFMESSRAQHETSTLHIFNTRPKLGHFYGIPKQNRGYQMLLNDGWNEESGLGPAGEGQKYPVKTFLKRDRKGLGQPDTNVARVTHFNPGDVDAVKSVRRETRKTSAKRDWKKQLQREAAKTRALRRALS